MNLVEAISEDNVVHMETYKKARNIRRGLIPYKNTIFRLSPAEREREKAGLQYASYLQPQDVVVKMKLAIISEVEIG